MERQSLFMVQCRRVGVELETGRGQRHLVLTRLAHFPIHFTRGGAFHFAPGPHLPEMEAFPDVSKKVVDNTAIVLWRGSFPDWWLRIEKETYQDTTWLVMLYHLSVNTKHSWTHMTEEIQCLAKVFTLRFSYFFCITTCNLYGFLFGFHVMDIHKIVQIGEVKWKSGVCIWIQSLCYGAPK